MKQVPCSCPGCGDRRAHYENPEPRGKPVMVEVPDDHVGYAYCSIECSIYHKHNLETQEFVDRQILNDLEILFGAKEGEK